jgi:hypothetical protein
MCGSTKVSYPGPSPAEQHLMEQQAIALQAKTAALERQQQAAAEARISLAQMVQEERARRERAQQEYMASPLAQAYQKAQWRQLQLQSLEAKRYEKALRGKLPISEGTRQREADERKKLEESLSRRLGADWATTTSGIQTMNAFNERWGLIKDAERQGMLQFGGQQSLARQGAAEGALSNEWGRYMDLQQLDRADFSDMFQAVGQANQFGYAPTLSGYSSLIGSYSSAMQPYQAQRQAQFQADLYNAQNSGFGGLLGTALGIGTSAFLGPFKPWVLGGSGRVGYDSMIY